MSEQNSPIKYPLAYIQPDLHEWALYTLYQDKEKLQKAVEQMAVENILKAKRRVPLSEEIAKVLFQEKERIAETPWKVDRKDEPDFWKSIRKRLVTKSLDKTEDEVLQINKNIIQDIVKRYVAEITGDFKIKTFKFARRFLPILFQQLLNRTEKQFQRIWGAKTDIHRRVQIQGSVEEIRKLSSQGTIVLVPTHFSNLDSILVGWCADQIGLQALSYGGGLNLFNSTVPAYFMSRLGAYKVDRRKKNAFYLEALKAYSRYTIQTGVHSLFFPGGTRSRSGEIENRLKMGLLGTVIDAQVEQYVQNKSDKIFVIPVTLNYHFVLEAKSLIEQYLKNTGKELYLVEKHQFGGYFGLIKFLWKFFSQTSELVINFGKPLDVLGNFVTNEGISQDQFGKPIELKEYFISNGTIRHDVQRDSEYTKVLADRLVKRFHAENVVLSSHLVAFVAFNLLRKKYPKLNLYAILRLSVEDRQIHQEDFFTTMDTLRSRLKVLANRKEVFLSANIVQDKNIDILQHGIKNMSVYHEKKPLKIDQFGFITSDDLNLLYYYSNRLDGYSLARIILGHSEEFGIPEAQTADTKL